MGWWRYYTPRPAREVKGGIKAQSRRGAFAASWWGQRWIKVLESFDIGERLTRGRTYARKGQVMDIEIEKGRVWATVQGSRSHPYEVEMRFQPLSQAQWLRVAAALAERFITLARLLAGELPEDMEEIFAGAKLSLFPHRLRDLETDCSCPDWSNPCKHTAAVFYLLAEEFDRDPFLLFKLRGLDREELFELLGYRAAAAPALPEPDRLEAAKPRRKEPPLEPAAFWGGEELPGDLLGEVCVPIVAAALPKRLGGFPFWRGKTPFLEALEPFYLKASPLGLDVFSGLIQAPAAQAPAPVKPMEPPPRKAKVIPITSRQGKRPSKRAVVKKKPRKKPPG